MEQKFNEEATKQDEQEVLNNMSGPEMKDLSESEKVGIEKNMTELNLESHDLEIPMM